MTAQLSIKTLTAEEVAKAVGGKLTVYGNGDTPEITNITYDSRDVCPGSLFCAVKGERSDGHSFIESAIEKGAVLILADENAEIPMTTEPRENDGESFEEFENLWETRNFAVVTVEDTVKALGLLSGYYRSFSKAMIVAVTGSVGKTTTKEFISYVVAAGYETQKTEGNHNNEIGFPMTLFSLKPECEVAVLEMGMSSRGEISFMSKLAHPDVAVITNIGTAHIANLGSRENICEAKLEITDGMDDDGILIVCGDEPLLTCKKDVVSPKPIYVGIYNRRSDYKAMNIRMSAEGTVFDILQNGKAVINVEIPVVGRHNVYNALVAYTVGCMLGISETKIRLGLKEYVPTGMRQKIYEHAGITVIEDCYNASPESMKASIEVLCTIASKRKEARPCALLGDMLELGEDSRFFHDQLGQYAAQSGIVKLYCFGEMAETVAEAAVKKGVRIENIYVCSDVNRPDVMAKMIKSSISPGDILLVKASRGVAAERVLEILKERV